MATAATHLALLQAPEKTPGTFWPLSHGIGLSSWAKSHLVKKGAGFFTRLAAFEPGLQSGHLYFLNLSRFLGKHGTSPAKKPGPWWPLPGIAMWKDVEFFLSNVLIQTLENSLKKDVSFLLRFLPPAPLSFKLHLLEVWRGVI